MNVISHSSAYAFYPHATFVQYRSLRLVDGQLPTGVDRMVPIEKYARRGWHMLDPFAQPISLAEDRSPQSDFQSGFRWIGDRKTWTMRLQQALPNTFDSVQSNSWNLQSVAAPVITSNPIHHDGFRFHYQVALLEHAVHAWKELLRPNDGVEVCVMHVHSVLDARLTFTCRDDEALQLQLLTKFEEYARQRRESETG